MDWWGTYGEPSGPCAGLYFLYIVHGKNSFSLVMLTEGTSGEEWVASPEKGIQKHLRVR